MFPTGTIPFLKIPDVSGGCKCMLKDKKIGGGSGQCNFCKIQTILGGGSTDENLQEIENLDDSKLNQLDGGVTSYLNLDGLSPNQKKKFRQVADKLRKSNDYAYVNSNEGVKDAVKVSQMRSRKGQEKYLDSVILDEDAMNFAGSSPRTKRAASRARSMARKMKNSSYISPKATNKLYNRTNTVLVDVLDDNLPVMPARRMPRGGPMCSSLTEEQLQYARNANNGVPYQWKAFQTSLTMSMKNRLKRSPTYQGLRNPYQREVASLWSMAKEQCV